MLFALVILAAMILLTAPDSSTASAAAPSDLHPIRGLAAAGTDGQIISVLTDEHCVAYDLLRGTVTPLWIRSADERITAIAGSPREGRFLVCMANGDIQLHDAVFGGIVWRVALADGVPRGAAFSCEGTRVAVGTEQGSIRLFDAATGDEQLSIQVQTDVARLCFSRDGRQVFAPETENTVAAWDTASGECLTRFDGDVQQVTSLAASPDGGMLVAATSLGELHCWNLNDDRRHSLIADCGLPTMSITFASNSDRLFRGSTDGQVRDSIAGTPSERSWLAHRYGVCDLAFSQGSLVTAGFDGKVLIWDATFRDGVELCTEYAARKPGKVSVGRRLISG